MAVKCNLNLFPAVPANCSAGVRFASDHSAVPFCYGGRGLLIKMTSSQEGVETLPQRSMLIFQFNPTSVKQILSLYRDFVKFQSHPRYSILRRLLKKGKTFIELKGSFCPCIPKSWRQKLTFPRSGFSFCLYTGREINDQLFSRH